MHSYIYHPLPVGIGRNWVTTIDVFEYLRSSHSERTRLREEISRIHPGEPYSVRIWHEKSPGILQLSTVDTDDSFLRRLHACLQHERIRREDYERQNHLPPSLPDPEWSERSLLYPRFRPPVVPITNLPTPPCGFKLPVEEVSTPTTAQRRSQVLTVCQDPSDDQIAYKPPSHQRKNQIVISHFDSSPWKNSYEVYQYLYASKEYRTAILDHVKFRRGDTFRTLSVTHELLETPITIRHSDNDQDFCKILEERLGSGRSQPYL